MEFTALGRVADMSCSFHDGITGLRSVNPDKLGFATFTQKASYVQFLCLVLPRFLCISEAGKVRADAYLWGWASCTVTASKQVVSLAPAVEDYSMLVTYHRCTSNLSGPS
jgi:hypothetical protein